MVVIQPPAAGIFGDKGAHPALLDGGLFNLTPTIVPGKTEIGSPAFAGRVKVETRHLSTIPIKAARVLLWNHTFGGTHDEYGYCLQQTSDGGFIIAGDFKSDDTEHAFLLKTDAGGAQQWMHTYGEIVESTEARSVQQTSDGGYILAGSMPGGTTASIYLVKTDASGTAEWSKTYGGIALRTSAVSVLQAGDGGYVVLGTAEDDDKCLICALKADAAGTLVWLRGYWEMNHPTGVYEGSAIRQTKDGGYIIAGSATLSPDQDKTYSYLIKTNSEGIMLWDHVIDVGWHQENRARDVRQTSDEGFVLVGSANDDDKCCICIIKTDVNGIVTWSQGYEQVDQPGNWYDGLSIRQTSGGGYALTGYVGAEYGSKDIYTMVLAADGSRVWDQTYGSAGDDVGTSLVTTSDGCFAITGYTSSYGQGYQVFLLKVAPLDAAWVKDTIPLKISSTGLVKVTVTMKNTGSRAWSARDQIRLAARNKDATLLCSTAAKIPAREVVKPGETYTFSLILKAPVLLLKPKVYRLQFQMAGQDWFGDVVRKTVTIK